MARKYVLAFDAGTTSCRAIIFDRQGDIVGIANKEFEQIFPKAGWVEHDAVEIWQTQLAVANEVLESSGIPATDIASIGITNQRETTVVWDRKSGKPLMNAIVWQDRRTAGFCDELKARGLSEYVSESTGLLIDAYFSGTKINWILNNVDGARERAERGELCFGTIDSWLIWNLTGGRSHATDYSNASRTLLFNINSLQWDSRLLEEMGIPRSILPEVKASSGIFGYSTEYLFGGAAIPIASAVGDQQAALFGQACFGSGKVKATYGTGGSLLMNTGTSPIRSNKGLLTTIAWGVDGRVEYALEGLLFIVGAAVQWLRDGLRVIDDAADSERAALSVEDSDGVYVVPAFTGLSAPYWDQYARGTIVGITRGTSREHLIRATLESMAYQIKDVIGCMEEDSGIHNTELKVDGGASLNNFVMQFQADLLGVPVKRPKIVDSTARGAAFLAGLATGVWKDQNEINTTFELDREFIPSMDTEQVEALYKGWKRAVGRSLNWVE